MTHLNLLLQGIVVPELDWWSGPYTDLLSFDKIFWRRKIQLDASSKQSGKRKFAFSEAKQFFQQITTKNFFFCFSIKNVSSKSRREDFFKVNLKFSFSFPDFSFSGLVLVFKSGFQTWNSLHISISVLTFGQLMIVSLWFFYKALQQNPGFELFFS